MTTEVSSGERGRQESVGGDLTEEAGMERDLFEETILTLKMRMRPRAVIHL